MAVNKDGALWGTAAFEGTLSGYETTRSLRVFRIEAGVIDLVTPPLPEDAAFFRQPNATWEYPEDFEAIYREKDIDDGGYLDSCQMQVLFTVRGEPPYELQAEYVQMNPHGSRYASGAWACTAECVVSYVWDGAAYTPGERKCLPKEQWGVHAP